MPFLHGFRRIVFEYQPLVEAVLSLLTPEEPEQEPESATTRRPAGGERGPEALARLLERERSSPLFQQGVSCCLLKVVELGLPGAARVLLRHGADLGFEDPVSYYNPLHVAVLKNQPHMITLLADHGADIHKRDRVHESSPLDLASEEAERLPCLRELLRLGADVNAADRNGKTSLLHALASSDGLTVNNAQNIELLLQNGADVNAAALDGESPVSSLAFLVKEALESSAEEAELMGRFCTRVARLLMVHGADPACCLSAVGGAVWEPSLTRTSLENYDLLFPLAALLLQHGASFFCSHRGSASWTGPGLIFARLAEALGRGGAREAELVGKAEVLLDLAVVCCPALPPLFPRAELPLLDTPSCPRPVTELYARLEEQQKRPPPLRSLCRRRVLLCLRPGALEEKVRVLPLPERLKSLLLPEHTWAARPGWDRFCPHPRPQ